MPIYAARPIRGAPENGRLHPQRLLSTQAEIHAAWGRTFDSERAAPGRGTRTANAVDPGSPPSTGSPST